MAGKAYVGTSGWQYRDWRGTFYPEDIPQRAWLPYLSEELDTVEVNASFYRLPRKEHVDKWVEETTSRFRIAMKMWRGVTHYKKLKDARPKLRPFFDAANRIPTKHRAPILVQLPPNQGKDVEKLDHFLDQVKKATPSQHWKIAVEFRSDDWYDDDVTKVLNKRRAAQCVHDMKGAGAVDEPNDASFVYMRRHGPGGDTSKNYSPARVKKDAKRVEDWLDEGKTVFVYYNNDRDGHAAKNARRLKEELGNG